jgi:hypothetical protein
MERQRGRGRPPKFTREDRAYLAGLIREHGIAGAVRESRILVCDKTLAKIANEYGIILRQGKRPRKAA